jgi:hypothetical protein
VVVTGPSRWDNTGHAKVLSNTGSLTVNVGVAPPQPPVGGPVIGLTSQSNDVAAAGDRITLYVSATETNSSATLTRYVWSAANGTLGTATIAPDMSYSYVEWTAPALMSSSQTVAVVVTDSQGATTSHAFAIDPAIAP